MGYGKSNGSIDCGIEVFFLNEIVGGRGGSGLDWEDTIGVFEWSCPSMLYANADTCVSIF